MVPPASADSFIASPVGLSLSHMILQRTMVAPNALASCPETGSTQHDTGPRRVLCWWTTPTPSAGSLRVTCPTGRS
ncbi:hypothetical protein CGRA01v4_00808 [Colletotrichum graminicola]|nr:hypothetical protein CGRA01v4_00808 [Colletotrichum graminicola]